MAANKTLQYFLAPLLKKFFQDMGRDPNNLEMILIKQKAGQLLKDSNKIINFPQKRSFVEEMKAMKKSGDIVDPSKLKKNENVLYREMFRNSNLNKDTSLIGQINEKMDNINKASKKLSEIMKERDEMFKPKSDAEIAAKYDKQNKESIKRFKNKMKKEDEFPDTRDNPLNPFDKDLDDFALGGRAGHYTGGMVDVEPNLSDIGHGSDALMARTRVVSPGSQATTSTGLNYLLAEDNDNIRVPFAGGGDPKRRAFLKLLASLGGGIAGIKSGILKLSGKEATKKAVPEIVKQSTGSGHPPPYFYELMETITKNGREIKSYGERVKQTVAKSKDGESELMLTEDLNTGSIQIKKIHKENDDMVSKTEEMNFTKNQGDESTKGKPADDYEEVTEYNSRIYKDEFNDPDWEEGIDVENIVKEIDVKKADGGRIGFSSGNLAKLLAGKKITGSSRRFLEKVFGKERFEEMIAGDPDLHRGMLEVVEMFRNKDREGLKMYMQKFLPHMDDETVEDFIIGSEGIQGIQGQLLRLGSGRDYRDKIQMIKEADNIRKLDALDIDKMKPNAEGGRIGKWMGGGLGIGKGQLRELLKYMAKNSQHGKSPSEMLYMVNPKQFNKMLNDPSIAGKSSPEYPEGVAGLIQEYKSKMKTDRANMVGDLIGTGRKMKKVDDDIVTYKIKIVEDMISKGVDREMAEEMAETMAQMVSQQAGKKATPKLTDRGLLEMENIQKNLLTKDRKLQAQGGLTTMLGE